MAHKKPKNEDDKKRDEVLARMLRTPPKPHTGKGDKNEGGSRRPKSDSTN